MTRVSCWRSVLAGVLAISAAGSQAAAQVVRGTVVSAAVPGGIPGAVVLLVDSANSVAARTLTGPHGEFALRAPAAAAYRVRALRIGYRPTVTAAMAITGDTAVVVRVEDIPVALPAVTTREETQCQLRPDSGLALAVLWSDATTALLATAITGEGAAYTFDMVDHVRRFDFESGDLQSVELAEGRVRGSRSWMSVEPEQLRHDGYVIERPDSTTFIAPDISTLLSPYFADAHCMRIVPAHGDSSIVIQFDPLSTITHPEVGGTITLDRRSHELRGLAFHYVNARLGAADSIAGGRVSFTRLRTGAWVISDWLIRAPELRVESSGRQNLMRPTPGLLGRFRTPPAIYRTERRLVVGAVRATGGTLRSVTLGDSIVWRRGPRNIDVRVDGPDAARGDQSNQVTVYLVGSRRYATADSSGTAMIRDLVPGSYLLEVGSTELDILGWERRRLRVDVDVDSEATTTVHLDGSMAAAKAACMDDARLLSNATGVLIGSVLRGVDPVADQEVTLSWRKDTLATPAPDNVVSKTLKTMAGDGRFFACGVPRDRPIDVRVSGVPDPLSARLARDQVVGIVAVNLKP